MAGTRITVGLYIPQVAVGANKIHFDLFNATGSAARLWLRSVQPIISGSTAVTGVVGVDLFLTRTSAVGTGGTAATYNQTTLTNPGLMVLNADGVISPSVTARAAPGGGATARGVISSSSVFTEETNSAPYTPVNDMVVNGRMDDIGIGILIPEGTGISVVQGSVASVGTVGYNVIFQFEGK